MREVLVVGHAEKVELVRVAVVQVASVIMGQRSHSRETVALTARCERDDIIAFPEAHPVHPRGLTFKTSVGSRSAEDG